MINQTLLFDVNAYLTSLFRLLLYYGKCVHYQSSLSSSTLTLGGVRMNKTLNELNIFIRKVKIK